MNLAAKIARLIHALLNELSDQSAYQRHLRNSGRPHSPAEWREFTNHRYRRKYQNAKCC